MKKLIINQDKIKDKQLSISLCPFAAIEINSNNLLELNSNCKMCGLCVKNGPKNGFVFFETGYASFDKSIWSGVAVYVEISSGIVHPVSYELIGKALELAKKLNTKVQCVLIGSNLENCANDILDYGVDNCYIYEDLELEHFRVEPYTSIFCDFIKNVKPSIVLVGGTELGRSLAPRAAARLRTGLTADCTFLDVNDKSGDLEQIRPAFGGNIMAHIRTSNHRPQFATVRCKIFNLPIKIGRKPDSSIIKNIISKEWLNSSIEVLSVCKKTQSANIEDAEVLVVPGRGFKNRSELEKVYALADALNGQVASTRPLIERGWFESKKQIGLSGRTVNPKLIITCGVSGSVQFIAGMSNSETVIAINSDKDAPIFKIANYALIGDMHSIIDSLLKKLKRRNYTQTS